MQRATGSVEEHPNDKQYRVYKEYAGFRNGILSLLLTKLLEGFAVSGPGYVTINGNNIVIDPKVIPVIASRVPLTPVVVLELFYNFQRPHQMEKGELQLGHLLTHGHSLLELNQEVQDHRLVHLENSLFSRLDIMACANGLEKSPADYEPPFTTISTSCPLEQPYWEQAFADSRHGHYYKYAYSY